MGCGVAPVRSGMSADVEETQIRRGLGRGRRVVDRRAARPHPACARRRCRLPGIGDRRRGGPDRPGRPRRRADRHRSGQQPEDGVRVRPGTARARRPADAAGHRAVSHRGPQADRGAHARHRRRHALARVLPRRAAARRGQHALRAAVRGRPVARHAELLRGGAGRLPRRRRARGARAGRARRSRPRRLVPPGTDGAGAGQPGPHRAGQGHHHVSPRGAGGRGVRGAAPSLAAHQLQADRRRGAGGGDRDARRGDRARGGDQPAANR